ncbi:MAG: hypothetical protein WD315_01540 [Balneolaceae bacterium]
MSISPTALFLQERAPFANVIVSNGAADAQEVSISFDFGYSVSDEEGNITMEYLDNTNSRSLNEYLNAFPRNFMLDPGERQTVRIAVRGLNDGEDGTYWSRARILASPMSASVESVQQESVAARININFEQVIPVFYRKGESVTGVKLNDVTFVQNEGNQNHFLVDLERTGNSPFVGSIETRIQNSSGEVVLEQRSNISVYYDLRRRLNLDRNDLPPGNYQVDFLIQSRRRDISSSHLLQIEPVQLTQSFRIE